MYITVFKPFFDFILSLLLILILSPVIILLYIVVFANLGNPVLFCQYRPGKNGKIFKLFKFRTMTGEISANGELLPDNKRITKLGAFLRKTSLDELPQLFNVVKGDMSMVGPRPLLVEYLQHYSLTQARRHKVKPGITGWAQINGRNAISWEEKFILDVWYADNISLILDIKIFFRTILNVIMLKSINQSQDITMELFTSKK
ncbi:MAG: sugar transferase [Bacteroidota bacterium]